MAHRFYGGPSSGITNGGTAYIGLGVFETAETDNQLKDYTGRTYTFLACNVAIATSTSATLKFRDDGVTGSSLSVSLSTTGIKEDTTGSETTAADSLFNFIHDASADMHGASTNIGAVGVTHTGSKLWVRDFGAISNNATLNLSLGDGGSGNGTIYADIQMFRSQTASDLRVHVVGLSTGAAQYTLLKNSVSTSLTVGISGTGSVEDVTNTASFAAGDYARWYLNGSYTGLDLASAQTDCDTTTTSSQTHQLLLNNTGGTVDVQFGSGGSSISHTQRLGSVSAGNLMGYVSQIRTGATMTCSLLINTTTSTNVSYSVTATGRTADTTGSESVADTDVIKFRTVVSGGSSGGLYVDVGNVEIPYISSGTTVTKDVTTTAAVTDTITKDVSSTAAVTDTITKDVDSTAAVSRTLTKDVSSTASTILVGEKDVTSTAAITDTIDKDVNSTAAVSRTLTTDVTSNASVAFVGEKDVTTTGAVTRTLTSNVTSDAAVSITATSNVTTDAAVTTTEESSVTTDAAVSQTAESNVTTDASITVSATGSKDVSSTAAITDTLTSDVSSTAAVTRTLTSDVSSTAAVTRTLSLNVTTDAVVVRTGQDDVTTDASLTAPVGLNVTSTAAVTTTVTKDVSSTAAVTRTLTSDVSSTAAVTRTLESNVTSTAAVSQTGTKDVSSTAATTAPASKDVSSTAATTATATKNVSTDASITTSGTVNLDVTTTAAITDTITKDVGSTAAVTDTIDKDVSSTAAVSRTGSDDVSTTAAVSRTGSKEVSTDAATQAPAYRDVTTDAAVDVPASKDVSSTAAVSATATKDVTSTAAIEMVSYFQTVLSDGPVAYWRLDDNAASTTGVDIADSHDSTWTTNTTNLQTGFSFIEDGVAPGGQFNLQGGTHHGTVVDSAEFDADYISVEAWFTVEPGSQAGAVINFREQTGNVGGFSLEGMTGDDTIYNFWVRIGGTWYTAQTTNWKLGPDRTHYIVGTYDGTYLRLYDNGKLIAETAQSGVMNKPTTPTFEIGRNISGGTKFNGKLAEVAFYDYALTPAQILEHWYAAFNAGVNLVYTEAAIQVTANKNVTSDAVVTRTGSADVTSNAAVLRTETKDVTTDAAVTRTITSDVSTDAAVSQTGQDDVTSDAAVQVTATKDVSTTAATTAPATKNVTTDASITTTAPITKDVTTTASIMPLIPSGVIIAWPSSAASIPTGWTRVTAMDERFPRTVLNNTTNGGGTGGSQSHQHTVPSHTHTMTHSHGNWQSNTPTASETAQASGNPGASISHTHELTSGSTGPTSSSATDTTEFNFPSTGGSAVTHDKVIWIQSNGTTTHWPASVWAFTTSTSIPTDWLLLNGVAATPNLANVFLLGANAGGDGASTTTTGTHNHNYQWASGTHVHTIPSHQHTLSAVGADGSGGPPYVNGGAVQTANYLHLHLSWPANVDSATGTSNGSGDTTSSMAIRPSKFVSMVTMKSNVINWSGRVIALWTGTYASVPSGWYICDGNNGTPNLLGNYYLQSSTSSTGSTTTGESHSHTVNHTHTMGVHTHASSTASGTTDTGYALFGSLVTSSRASLAHTHFPGTTPASAQFSSSNGGSSGVGSIDPPYIDVIPILWKGYSTGKSVTTDASLMGAGQDDVTTTAAVTDTVEKNVTTDAAVARTLALEVSSDAAVTRTLSSDVATDAAVQVGFNSDVTTTAVVTRTLTKDVSTDASTIQLGEEDVTTTGSISISFMFKLVTSDAIIVRTPVLSVTTDAVVIRTGAAEVTTDARIQVFNTITSNVTTDASISINFGWELVTSDAHINAPVRPRPLRLAGSSIVEEAPEAGRPTVTGTGGGTPRVSSDAPEAGRSVY